MEDSMITGTPWKKILSFSIPVFIGLLLQQLYNTVDTIVVGNFASEEALAAVGTTASMITLFLAAAVGFSTGAGVITAQYFGAGQKERMKEASAVAVTFLLVMGIVMTGLGILSGRIILAGFLDVPEDFLEIAVRYFYIYCLGLVFQFGYNIVAALLRSVGDSKASMYFLLIAAVVNIVLDLIFVAGLHWGASGAAIATGISQAFSCVASFVYMNRKYPVFRFGIHDFKWDSKDIRMILKMGVPIVLQQMLVGVGIMAIQRAVNSYGQSMTASFTVGSRIEMYVQMPLNSFNMALGTFVGQNIGAGKNERIAVGVRHTLVLSLVITAVISTAVYLFQGQIIRLFALSPDATVYCRQHLTLIAAAFLLQSVYLPLCGVFQGAGHTVYVLDVAHMDIKPCMGCYAGKSEGHCIAHKDDMYLVEQALAKTDMVVYVTPVYFYDMSAQLKLVIDRLHCFYGSLLGKKSLLLATAWRQDDEVMFYLRNLYNGMAEYLRYENLGAVMAKGCGSPETIHGSRYAKEAYQFGKSLK